jgi:hypothetical protein
MADVLHLVGTPGSFRVGRQEDAQEFMVHLLDALEISAIDQCQWRPGGRRVTPGRWSGLLSLSASGLRRKRGNHHCAPRTIRVSHHFLKNNNNKPRH